MKTAVNFKKIKKIFVIIVVFAFVMNINSIFVVLEKIMNIPTAYAESNSIDIESIWENSYGNYNLNDDYTPNNDNFWADTSDKKITVIDTDSVEISDQLTYSTETASGNVIGQKINEMVLKEIDDKVEEKYYTGISNLDEYDGTYENENGNNYNLYYTIEQSASPSGYYRKYYVSTADQLMALLYNYGNNFANTLKAKKGNSNADIKSGTLVNKLGIVLLCDIDLGGKYDKSWKGYRNTSVYLEIDGQGHTIYNGYYSSGYFLSAGDNKFSIKDVTFSNHFINHGNGMFGKNVKWAYFENVDWESCVAIADTETTIALGSYYVDCYFKDCTIRNSCAVGKLGNEKNSDSNGHCGMFASYNNTTAVTSNFEFPTSIPSELSDIEKIWSKNYPSIYEGCATINCDVYQLKSGAFHSGIFVSCMQSNIIFRNCFSNGAIYGQQQLGVFIGAVIGSANGFMYEDPDDSEKTIRVNAVFENCYSSGEVEGKSKLGGFVGMIFNDGRATGDTILNPPFTGTSSNLRGITIFKNCYSTASVGMEYSGAYIGGFVGLMRGNIKASDLDDIKHRFINCYAAGEVGGIKTNTSIDEDNENTIGGFLGTYCKADYNYTYEDEYGTLVTETDTSGIMTNCYYDMQTTAMRERDIGNYTEYETNGKFYKEDYIKNGDSSLLNRTLDGLTGVYTKSSEYKDVAGLTDTVDLGDEYECFLGEYYPQLKVFTTDNEYANGEYDYNSLSDIEKMKYDRAIDYYNYAIASTSTVFLDHYDDMIDENGNDMDKDEVVKYKTVYDTVRDITSKFTFTTDGSNDITWYDDDWTSDDTKNTYNAKKNKLSNFYSKMGKDENSQTGFTVSYGEKLADGSTLTETFDPKVITISQVDDVWKCLDFAPGKQWVTVETSKSNTSTENHIARRDLRLLPMAYLNAGNIIHVNVVTNDTDEETDNNSDISNTIYYMQYDLKEISEDGATEVEYEKVASEKKLNSDKFDHSIGVVYAISDRYRMSGTTYTTQKLNEYNYNETLIEDTETFAFYTKFEDSEQKICSVSDDEEKTIGMLDQSFNITSSSNYSYLDNLAYSKDDGSSGTTRVRIFQADITENNNTTKLDKGNEIEYTQDNIAKWNGEELFTTDDVGCYYLEYYWRLNDGRFLEDLKLVRITADTYNVEIITGVLGEDNTDNIIQQYATDEFEEENGSLKTTPSYADVNTYQYQNVSAVYNENDVYDTKSVKISTDGDKTVVGWQRDPEYILTTLIIEAVDQYGVVRPMARISYQGDNSYQWENGSYKYNQKTFSITQDSDTKLFKITENKTTDIDFYVRVQTLENVESDTINKYIIFDFNTNEGQSDDTNSEASYTETNDNLRVTALFRKNTAEIEGTKYVLYNPKNESTAIDSQQEVASSKNDNGEIVQSELKDYIYYNSLTDENKDYEVDNSVLSEDSTDIERKAVLSGDILTYRIKLRNLGYADSNAVNVYDNIPENCTYVDGSMKIYLQQIMDKNYSLDEFKQVELVAQMEMVNGTETLKTISEDYNMTSKDGLLTWTIPNIAIDDEYYVEYQVKVGNLDVSELKSSIENTAIWDYTSSTGNTTDSDDMIGSGIFDIQIEKTESENSIYDYTITVSKNSNDTNSYEDISLENVFPDGFKLTSAITISGNNSSELTINSSDDKFEITGLQDNTNYTISFSGTQEELKTDDDIIKDTATIKFKKKTDNTDDAVDNQMNNTTIFTKRLSNEVTTDVTHLYLNIEKDIPSADTSQTFVFKIERSETENSAPTDVFYTTINCEDTSGNVIIQLDKRGYYRISEVTGWSATDYDFKEESITEIYKNYPKNVTKQLVENDNTKNGEITIYEPRMEYVSQAFPTSLGTDEILTTKVTFTNKESDYAFLSSQSYVKNIISNRIN